MREGIKGLIRVWISLVFGGYFDLEKLEKLS